MMNNIWVAAARGDVDALRRIIASGVDPNQGDYDYRTPLHVACSEGQEAAVRYLIEEAGVKIDVRDRFGGSPLQDAKNNEHQSIIDLLNQFGASSAPPASFQRAPTLISFDDEDNLSEHSSLLETPWQAAAAGDVQLLRRFHRDGVDLNQADYDRRTPLHLAASEGRLDAVKFLVEEAKVDVNQRDRWRGTALRDAEKHGHDVVTAYLRDLALASHSPNSNSHHHEQHEHHLSSRTRTHTSITREKREEQLAKAEPHDPLLGPKSEMVLFALFALFFEAFIITLYAVWLDYLPAHEAGEDVRLYWNYARDVSIMIFFGFGFLMTFLRRYGFSAIGYTFVISAMVVQWSLLLEQFFEEVHEHASFSARRGVGVFNLLNGLFCAGSVMISYGAILGKVTPLQMLVLGFIEPVFYWVNLYICGFVLEALDIGGGYFIHIFGCYFGLSVCLFITNIRTHSHPDNTSCYSSDVFAMAGTLFLWMMWPSFNAAIAAEGIHAMRALVNTFLSLTGATLSTFIFSRILCEGKFEMVHVQNSTLAGGVAMGIAADLYLHPASAIAVGFIAGTVSVFGYRFLTPFLNNYLHCQDTCGINNLHGMPGIIGAIVSIFATLAISQNGPDDTFPHGTWQPAIQFAALGITLGIAIFAGVCTGALLWVMQFINPIHRRDYYHDRGFWNFPSDYEYVINKSDNDMELEPM